MPPMWPYPGTRAAQAWPNLLLYSLTLLGMLALGACSLTFVRAGFDLTDEGFYLNWISAPSEQAPSISQFGFLYHPIYLLAGTDAGWLRVINLVFSYALGVWLCARIWSLAGLASDPPRSGVAMAAWACATLFMAHQWLITPSYNSLTLQALLLVALGLLGMPVAVTAWPRGRCALVGVGLWLAVMAKPSSGALLPLAVIAWSLLAGRWHGPSLMRVGLLALALIALSALWIDGSWSAWLQRYRDGMTSMRALAGGHSLGQAIRVDPVPLKLHRSIIVIAMLSLMSGLAWAWERPHGSRWHWAAAVLMGLVTAAVFGPMVLGQTLSFAWLQSPRFLAALPALVLGTWAVLGGLRSGFHQPLARPLGAAAAFLFTLPYIYAFGSNNNYWHVGATAGLFWSLGGLCLLGMTWPRAQRQRLAQLGGLGMVWVVGLYLHLAWQYPYRQSGPLWAAVHPVRPLGATGTFHVDAARALYIRQVQSLAIEQGWHSGAPMLDWTGESPGVLYMMGARSVGPAWLIGGYAGSSGLARLTLQQIPCAQLAQAWLLWSPQGERHLPDAVLIEVGLRPASDQYATVAHLRPPPTATNARADQWLLRPVNVAASSLRNCRPTP